MSTKNQSGIAHLGILLAVIVVAAIGGVGWYVWEKNKTEDTKTTTAITNFDECVAAGNPVMESYPEQCSANGQTFVNNKQQAVLSLDKTKLPQGWYDTVVGEDVISLDNSAIGLEPEDSCTVAVHSTKDETAKELEQAVFADKQRADYAQTINAEKGYETTKQADTTVVVMLNGQRTELTSFYDLVTLPASEFGMYEKKAYIVKDGHYVFIHQSCRGTDFDNADEALLAISIQL